MVLWSEFRISNTESLDLSAAAAPVRLKSCHRRSQTLLKRQFLQLVCAHSTVFLIRSLVETAVLKPWLTLSLAEYLLS